MIKEVKFMSSVVDRERARQFGSMIEHLVSIPENEEIRLEAKDLLSLLSVMRDYTVMTHLSGADSEIATAISDLADYVEDGSSNADTKNKLYKTTELARCFGVSVTAINKWIEEGRFVGYKREPRQHAYIPFFTPFLLRDGSSIQLGKLIEDYQNKQPSFADDDERQLLIQELIQLQNKYNAKTFNEAFEGSPTADQESDMTWWMFYEKKLSELDG
jgi:hypothetical protein